MSVHGLHDRCLRPDTREDAGGLAPDRPASDPRHGGRDRPRRERSIPGDDPLAVRRGRGEFEDAGSARQDPPVPSGLDLCARLGPDRGNARPPEEPAPSGHGGSGGSCRTVTSAPPCDARKAPAVPAGAATRTTARTAISFLLFRLSGCLCGAIAFPAAAGAAGRPGRRLPHADGPGRPPIQEFPRKADGRDTDP